MAGSIQFTRIEEDEEIIDVAEFGLDTAPLIRVIAEKQWNRKLTTYDDELNYMNNRPACGCLDPQYENRRWSELRLHSESQDTSCDAWKRLLDLVDMAACDGREEFAPGREMQREHWIQIVTLPPSIAKLKSVKRLMLYGSGLVRIPPQIAEMTDLEEFTPYTSYRLHWFPYEITRCARLKNSTVSTRALYGNYKYRPPFPRLPSISGEITPSCCSVCGGSFAKSGPRQFWVSLRVATDVLPLLVHTCSVECVRSLPKSAEGYLPEPHQGGLELKQPAAYW